MRAAGIDLAFSCASLRASSHRLDTRHFCTALPPSRPERATSLKIVARWQAVVVFPDRATDIGQTGPYEVLLQGGVLHRIYLTDLLDQPDLGLGARLVRLVVMDAASLVVEARALIDEQDPRRAP